MHTLRGFTAAKCYPASSGVMPPKVRKAGILAVSSFRASEARSRVGAAEAEEIGFMNGIASVKDGNYCLWLGNHLEDERHRAPPVSVTTVLVFPYARTFSDQCANTVNEARRSKRESHFETM